MKLYKVTLFVALERDDLPSPATFDWPTLLDTPWVSHVRSEKVGDHVGPPVITDSVLWDSAAEALGFDIKNPAARYAATVSLGTRPPGPDKYASPRCESGRRNYCTCDTCF